MNLPQSLLDEFAKVTNDTTPTNTEKTVYGTYSVNQNGKAFVMLDGAQSATPVANAMDAKTGDRVAVMIKDHKAVVMGNLTMPASARTATGYMQFKNEGLVVGALDNSGNPTGPYVVVGNSDFKVYNSSSTLLATFGADGTELRSSAGTILASFKSNLAKITTGSYQIVNTANKVLAEFSESKATLANGEGVIQVFNHILFLIGLKAVGVRTSFKSGSTTYYSELVAQCDSTSPQASLQVRNDATSPVASSVIVSMDGVRVNTPAGKTMYINNSEVLHANQILAVGSATVTGNLNGNSRYDFTVTISNIPSNYILTGVRSINVTDNAHNARTWFKLIRFVTNPSNNTITATVFNSESSKKAIRVTFEWFAIRNTGSSTVPSPEVIDLGDIGN